jgi:hypothetical protein
MKSVPLLVAVFCVATAGSLLSQALGGQSPVGGWPVLSRSEGRGREGPL